MDSDFKEKIKSIGFSHQHRGKTNVTPVIRDVDGTVGGYRKEHWNDRVDSKVTKADFVLNPAIEVRRVNE